MLNGNGSETSLTVSWTAVNDPMYNILYIVKYSTDSGTETDPPSDAMKRSGITATSTTLTGLQSNTTYYVWVAAEILGAGVQGTYSVRVSYLYIFRLERYLVINLVNGSLICVINHIADEDLQVDTFYSKDLMLLLLNKLHISCN